MSRTISSDIERNRILVGDVRQMLDAIPDASVDTVITSPPYFRLRNYQTDDQIGLEDHVDGWVDELLPGLLKHPCFEGARSAAVRARTAHLHGFVVDMRPRTPRERRRLTQLEPRSPGQT